jgi:diadenosine tetraphosphate (Ap4A) HIT family hydrolase
MEIQDCYVCNWISRIDDDEKKYYIAELETGFVFLSSKWQYFKGYTFFVSKLHVNELHLMPKEFRQTFLLEMTIVSEAVYNAFKTEKINCESLGNSCSHVHWHIIPRYGTDPCPDKTIWNLERTILDSVILSDNELLRIQQILVAEMKELSIKYQIKAVFK